MGQLTVGRLQRVEVEYSGEITEYDLIPPDYSGGERTP